MNAKVFWGCKEGESNDSY